jgi:hypothetical protein
MLILHHHHTMVRPQWVVAVNIPFRCRREGKQLLKHLLWGRQMRANVINPSFNRRLGNRDQEQRGQEQRNVPETDATHIRRYLSSAPLLPTVHKRFMISQCKDGLKSKLRSSRACITLRMSPLGVAPQVSDHGCEGSTIPWPSARAQGAKRLRQDLGGCHRSLAGRNHHLKPMLSRMCEEPLQRGRSKRGPEQRCSNMRIFCSKGMEICRRFPCLAYQCNLPPQCVSQAYFRHILSCLRKIGSERDKGLGLCMPACDQSQTKRWRIHQPLHVQRAALLLGPCGDDGLDIAILTRLHALAIFTNGIDDAGIHACFATHEQEPAMAIHVSERGQIAIAPVGQAQRALQTCRGRQIIVFGVRVGAQDDREGGILEYIHGAMPCDSRGLHGGDAAREHL